eukprot:g28312.t1
MQEGCLFPTFLERVDLMVDAQLLQGFNKEESLKINALVERAKSAGKWNNDHVKELFDQIDRASLASNWLLVAQLADLSARMFQNSVPQLAVKVLKEVAVRYQSPHYHEQLAPQLQKIMLAVEVCPEASLPTASRAARKLFLPVLLEELLDENLSLARRFDSGEVISFLLELKHYTANQDSLKTIRSHLDRLGHHLASATDFQLAGIMMEVVQQVIESCKTSKAKESYIQKYCQGVSKDHKENEARALQDEIRKQILSDGLTLFERTRMFFSATNKVSEKPRIVSFPTVMTHLGDSIHLKGVWIDVGLTEIYMHAEGEALVLDGYPDCKQNISMTLPLCDISAFAFSGGPKFEITCDYDVEVKNKTPPTDQEIVDLDVLPAPMHMQLSREHYELATRLLQERARQPAAQQEARSHPVVKETKNTGKGRKISYATTQNFISMGDLSQKEFLSDSLSITSFNNSQKSGGDIMINRAQTPKAAGGSLGTPRPRLPLSRKIAEEASREKSKGIPTAEEREEAGDLDEVTEKAGAKGQAITKNSKEAKGKKSDKEKGSVMEEEELEITDLTQQNNKILKGKPREKENAITQSKAKEKTEEEVASEVGEKEAKAKEKAEKEKSERAEKEKNEKAEKAKQRKIAKKKEQEKEKKKQEKMEKEAKEKKEKKERKEKEAKEKKERIEKEAKEKKEKMEKEAKEKKEKMEKEAKEKRARMEKEAKEEKEKMEKEAKEKKARMEKEAKEKKEKMEKEAKEKKARMEKEAKEKKEKMEKEAKEKKARMEKEAKEKKETMEKEAKENEKIEREAKEKKERMDKKKAEKKARQQDIDKKAADQTKARENGPQRSGRGKKKDGTGGKGEREKTAGKSEPEQAKKATEVEEKDGDKRKSSAQGGVDKTEEIEVSRSQSDMGPAASRKKRSPTRRTMSVRPHKKSRSESTDGKEKTPSKPSPFDFTGSQKDEVRKADGGDARLKLTLKASKGNFEAGLQETSLKRRSSRKRKTLEEDTPELADALCSQSPPVSLAQSKTGAADAEGDSGPLRRSPRIARIDIDKDKLGTATAEKTTPLLGKPMLSRGTSRASAATKPNGSPLETFWKEQFEAERKAKEELLTELRKKPTTATERRPSIRPVVVEEEPLFTDLGAATNGELGHLVQQLKQKVAAWRTKLEEDLGSIVQDGLDEIISSAEYTRKSLESASVEFAAQKIGLANTLLEDMTRWHSQYQQASETWQNDMERHNRSLLKEVKKQSASLQSLLGALGTKIQEPITIQRAHMEEQLQIILDELVNPSLHERQRIPALWKLNFMTLSMDRLYTIIRPEPIPISPTPCNRSLFPPADDLRRGTVTRVDAPTSTDLLPHHSPPPAPGNEQSGKKADEDSSGDEGEKSPRPTTYSPNYAFMSDLIPPSPIIETGDRDRDEEKEEHRRGIDVMKRGRKLKERVVLSGETRQDSRTYVGGGLGEANLRYLPQVTGAVC